MIVYPGTNKLNTMENVIDFAQKYAYDFKHDAPKGYEEFNLDWFISDKGDLLNRRGDYILEHCFLTMPDWILILSEKRWFDANTFIPAYYEACRRAGIKKITMKVDF